MHRFRLIFGGLAIAGLAAGLYGCAASNTPEQGGSPPPVEPADVGHAAQGGQQGQMAHEEHGEHAAEGKSEMEKMEQGLAKLSDEDRASAMKQHFCPVSDKMLGTMGAPIKVDVNGQVVWICCPACKNKLLKDPDKYLAKLNQ